MTDRTAGAAIRFNGTDSGDAVRIDSVTVSGFYTGIRFDDGAEWYMTNCAIQDFAKWGLFISHPDLPDGGDQGIVNCQFIAGPNRLSPQAGIYWESGGGTRIANCKFNQRGSAAAVLGIYGRIADGAVTSVFQVTGCSIEGSNYGMAVEHKGPSNTGQLHKSPSPVTSS